jgi:hypothetical protein
LKKVSEISNLKLPFNSLSVTLCPFLPFIIFPLQARSWEELLRMSNASVAASGSIEMDTVNKTLPQDVFNIDIEQTAVDDAHLLNNTVRNFVWQGVTVTVKDHKTKLPKTILENVDGIVEAGKFPTLVTLMRCLLDGLLFYR